MRNFKTANSVATTAFSRSSAAYKAVPDRSTSAIASGLNRLFNTPTLRSHENSQSSVSGQQQSWETHMAEQRREARELECVHMELDQYLEEPLDSFTRVEMVGNNARTVIFDILAYWQVRTLPLHLIILFLNHNRMQRRGFRTFSASRWTYYPRKRVQYPASVVGRECWLHKKVAFSTH